MKKSNNSSMINSFVKISDLEKKRERRSAPSDTLLFNYPDLLLAT